MKSHDNVQNLVISPTEIGSIPRRSLSGKQLLGIIGATISDVELRDLRLAHFDFVIRDAAERAIVAWEYSGGYMCSLAHIIQSDTSMENAETFIHAVKQHGARG